MKERVDNALYFAYRIWQAAKINLLTPKAWLLGFSIYYELRAYCLSNHFGCFNDQNGNETLFGLPINLTENKRYIISLLLDEFTFDDETDFI